MAGGRCWSSGPSWSGRSGLNLAIDAMPGSEQKIVFVRMREFEAGFTSNLAAIKDWPRTAATRTATTIEGSGGKWPEIIGLPARRRNWA